MQRRSWESLTRKYAPSAIRTAECKSGSFEHTTACDEPECSTCLQDVYIIGGLVDRNRHKNICLERAQQQVGHLQLFRACSGRAGSISRFGSDCRNEPELESLTNACRHPQGIRTARLPISGRVQLTSSTVLTVNQVNGRCSMASEQVSMSLVIVPGVLDCKLHRLQVVEIMLVYSETSDWGAALEKVIPSRKRGGTGNEARVEAGGEAKRAKTT